MAMINCLGETPSRIWSQAIEGHAQHLRPDTHWLRGKRTHVGAIEVTCPAVPNRLKAFDCGINRLLDVAMNSMLQDYQRLAQSIDPARIGVILGTSTAGIDSLEAALPEYDATGLWPQWYHTHHQRMAGCSEFLARKLGISGPVMSVSTACSSSAKAVLSAQRWLNAGQCDLVICGGIDVLCQLTLRGFDSLGALASERCLPFSSHRQGISIGEAVCLLVLSRDPAEVMVAGGGESSDAHHISAPDPTGRGAIEAMVGALSACDLRPGDIDYLNLHGTATEQNDRMEAQAVTAVFGTPEQQPWCSSTKAMTGHTLGAAGAVELGLSALSMSTFNEQCGYLPHVFDGAYDPQLSSLKLVEVGNALGRPRRILSNSFAFGGSNTSVILEAGT